jgi:hypothetical protein
MYRITRFLGGTGYCWTGRDDDVDFETHQFGHERGDTIGFSLCRSPFNDNVFPLHVPKLAEALTKRLGAGRVRRKGANK